MKQSLEDIRQFILLNLGYPAVRVELTQAHLDMAIKLALQIYSKYAYESKRIAIVNAYPNKTSYKLQEIIPEDDYKRLLHIGKVIYNPNAPLLYFNYFFNLNVPFYSTDMVSVFSLYPVDSGAYAILVATYTQLQRTFGQEGSYHVDGDTIHIHPRPRSATKFAVIYSVLLNIDEVNDTYWVKEYALAHAKELLGRIRSKFDSYPSPTGGVSLDGDKLLSEAKEEKEALINQFLQSYSQPNWVYTG